LGFKTGRLLLRQAIFAGVAVVWIGGRVSAEHQTTTLSPVHLNSVLPYKVSLQPYDFGAASLPTLHSFAAGHHDGKWVLIGGRTNGLHGFSNISTQNFPPEFQNREVWVIDPVARTSWSRSLESATAGFTAAEVNSLTPANNQFYQRGDRLFMTGGYGLFTAPSTNSTFDKLTAIDLPGMIDWVVNNTGMAKDHVRQISDPLFRVTGGAMYEMGGRTHLVFGQDFQGNYNPNKNGAYTNQVRSFNIVDDGVTLSITNPTTTTPDPNYRRRDLNIVPVLRPGAGGLEEGLTVLSGVFTPTFGAWTVPVEIDSQGNPSMADPDDPGTFKQGMNGYHAAKLGLYSESRGEMHQLIFGGISLQYLNATTGQIESDDNLPFVNDITSIVIDAAGQYTQHRIGEYPVLNDLDGIRLRFGANAEFFLAEGIETFANGVLKLDELTQPTTLGYIFGGIVTNGPHTRGTPPAASAGSNQIFAVVYTPIPEPSAVILAIIAGVAATRRRGRGDQWLTRQAPCRQARR
jgi:hypothetical protein